MVKGIYVALGLAVVGGAVVGVPRLAGGNNQAPSLSQAATAPAAANQYITRFAWFNVTRSGTESSSPAPLDWNTMWARGHGTSAGLSNGAGRFMSDLKAAYPKYDYELLAAPVLAFRDGQSASWESTIPRADGSRTTLSIKVTVEEASRRGILDIVRKIQSGTGHGSIGPIPTRIGLEVGQTQALFMPAAADSNVDVLAFSVAPGEQPDAPK